MKILVTGATGFVGKHLCECLLENTDAQIIGTTLHGVEDRLTECLTITPCDLLDKEQVEVLISQFRPDHIFHLAAVASVQNAWQDAEKVLTNNVLAQLNLLQSLVKNSIKPRFLIVSSGEVYGSVNALDLPINEEAKLQPNNPYAVSKLMQEFLGLQYFISYKVPVIIARSFNHSGPGQRGNFVIPSFASQIVDIENGKNEAAIKVGNLEAERDFLDVRDVVKAYLALVEKGEAGEIYNICSGRTVKIEDVLDILLKHSKAEIDVEEDKSRMRPSDTPILVGDNSKLIKATGWHPTIELRNTLIDTLNYLRESTVLEKTL